MLKSWKCAAAACMLAMAPLAQAQVQRSIINPSFESPALQTPGCRVYIGATRVPGWLSNHPAQAEENVVGCVVPAGFGSGGNLPLIELWRTPRDNSSGGAVSAPQGVQIAELNAAVASRLYQNVCLINGETFQWRFDHRGRASATVHDVANFVVGTSSVIAQVGTTNTGAFQTPVAGTGATLNAPAPVGGNTSWVGYTGTFAYPGATGVTSLGFEAGSSAGGITSGNLLDGIQIEMAPFVEFVQAASSGTEATGSNLPQLRVNGTVYRPMAVRVRITGGTATRGTDYTTPGNSDTLVITIPAGIYDGSSTASLFTLPITIVDDTVVEANETIQLQLEQSATTPQTYYRRSSTTCGSQGIIDTTYTIIDDDSALAVTKNAGTPVAVAGQANQFDIVYTVTVGNTSNTVAARYSLQDAIGFDADVSVVSASYTLNGGASTALGTTGSWTLQPQWKTLAAATTDTYRITVRGSIARTGGIANDACTTPGSSGNGLNNVATAVLQGTTSNTTYTASACQPTPTPFWLVMSKQFSARAQASDQAQVRVYASGLLATSATTTGTALTVATTARAFVVGTPIDLRETVLLNGTTASDPAAKYATTMNCTNALTGSSTALPSGAGVTVGNERDWPELSPSAGDDITCTVTNQPKADLSITKTSTTPQVQPGGTVTYSLVVANGGPGDASGALLKDEPGAGIASCSAVTCNAAAATGGATCPATLGIAAVLAGTQAVNLPANSSLTFQLTCQVSP